MILSFRWRLSLAILILSASDACLLLAQQKPVPSYRITGTVVNSRDNSPVLRCTITGRLVGRGRSVSHEPVMTETDERGHFLLSLPSAGNWELMASAHNIRPQPLDSHDGYFTGIVLTPQMPTYDVVFRAVPDASLNGLVTDEAGEAVRNAQVTLFSIDPEAQVTGSPTMQQRQSAQTDDRGHFDMEALNPGNYLVQVQARPWYAAAGPGQLRNQAVAVQTTQDPSLDVVYEATWYPGVADASSAGVLIAHAGDELRADFHLTPQPSAHLLIPSSASLPSQNNHPGNPGGIAGSPIPALSLLLPDGSLQQVFGQVSVSPTGDLDISGLAPGTYQVTLPGSGPMQSGHGSTVRIQSGSSTALSAAPLESSVTIVVDGGTDADPSQIVLADTATGRSFSASGRPGARPTATLGGSGQRPSGSAQRGLQAGSSLRTGGGQPRNSGPRGRSKPSKEGEEITLQIPPGQYDVSVRGDTAAFVTGLVASKSAVVVGRTITIPEGAVRLTVYIASGLAEVSGIASHGEQSSVGAMVLLVPITLGEAGSLTVVRRDQTNSDGSFHWNDVIPGRYILLAIERGWGVHWTDPATLQPYLMHGIPLDLRSSTNTRLMVVAQIP